MLSSFFILIKLKLLNLGLVKEDYFYLRIKAALNIKVREGTFTIIAAAIIASAKNMLLRLKVKGYNN
ncbi:uncharacterized protein TRIREDRAFT_112678 [Trichoderma reesei QM6a]|uniref:Predicted protein n=1 Tax=Hypocrea jecorina (strain QM6a) TaxID=431241 RepID=G0RXP3_HYPJQ|nr:uncharacterized protein TRIREDRAFT_112678 [Trichoderma reesei QM6a]EGR44048.1 predicted protein [Trichoderma reesei QM6a]